MTCEKVDGVRKNLLRLWRSLEDGVKDGSVFDVVQLIDKLIEARIADAVSPAEVPDKPPTPDPDATVSRESFDALEAAMAERDQARRERDRARDQRNEARGTVDTLRAGMRARRNEAAEVENDRDEAREEAHELRRDLDSARAHLASLMIDDHIKIRNVIDSECGKHE